MSAEPATLRRVFSHALYHPEAVQQVFGSLAPEAGATLELVPDGTALTLPANLEDADLLLAEICNQVLALTLELRGA
jgi:hypothetical protein